MFEDICLDLDQINENENKNKNKVKSGGLFNDPNIKAAIEALSEEDKLRYKKIGEALYEHIDYNENSVLNNMPLPMQEAVAYIEDQLRSGLHPSFLEEKEKVLLSDVYGKKWYEKWGYIEEDLKEIVTCKFNNNF